MERAELAMIAEGFERILSDATLEQIDAEGPSGEAGASLWTTLSENGYLSLCASEDHGGFGASLADITELAVLAGRYALPLPFIETVMGNALLATTGAEAVAHPLAIPDPADPGAPFAFATHTQGMLVLEGSHLRLYPAAEQAIAPSPQAEDAAGSFQGSPTNPIADYAAPNWLTADALRAIGALMRAAQMAGAMQRTLDLTLTYTQDREQFGRPLAKFQAIQHHLSDIACETAAAIAAVELASDALRCDPKCGPATIDELAIAKIRCGDAAARVAAAAHQSHGAMGFTREYALGRFTRRLWQWQDDFGSESAWAIRLGHAVFAEPSPCLWPRISQTV